MRKNGSSLNARTAMEEQYGFTIASEPVNVIENDSLISYTLRIERAVSDSGFFENLVIQKDQRSNETRAIILKYNLTSAIVPTVHGRSNFTADVESTPILFDTSDSGIENKDAAWICHYVIFTYCDYQGTHLAGEECANTYQGAPMLMGCEPGGTTPYDPGQGGPGGESPPGGGSGGGGTAPTPPCQGKNCPDSIITAPVLEELNLNEPCAELQKLSNNTKINNSIKSLNKTEIFEASFEKGSNFSMNSDQKLNATTIPPSARSGNSVRFSPGSAVFGGVHSHQNNLHPMFSYADIKQLFTFANQYNYANSGLTSPDYNIPVFMLVCKNGIYAIKIADFAKLQAIMNSLSDTEKYKDFKKKLVNRHDNRQGPLGQNTSSPDTYAEDFLKFVTEDFDMGVSLYKANTALTSWDKLELNTSNSGELINKIPCN